MSGHSHWAGIKHKKAANDAKRGKVWSKCARIIIVAAKAGGGDPAANLALRYAIEKAKSVNMPKDTIEKAIKKGTGDLEGVSFDEILYEGYGSSGVAIMVETLTDNRNRTGPEIKKMFERHGGSFGTAGCVSWMFSKKGIVTVNTASIAEEDLMDVALGAGADDMQTVGEVFEIICEPTQYDQLVTALRTRDIEIATSDLSMLPQNSIEITDADVAAKILKFMDALDDHDDVQNVSANFDISDEVMSKVE